MSFENVENFNFYPDDQHGSCTVGLSDEMIRAIKKSKCISLSIWKGSWHDLSFLSELDPPLKRLRIQSDNVDWKGVEKLSVLNRLSISGVVKEKMDFHCLTGLTSLEYHWDKKNSDSVFSHSCLEELKIYGVNDFDLSRFRGLESLESLEIIRGRIRSLSGIGELSELRALRLNDLRSLEDVSDLKKLQHLWCFHVGSCNKLDACDISGLNNLKELGLLRQKNISDLSFLNLLPGLEVFMALEMSILSGDVKILSTLPRLKSIRMDQKRHYNLNLNELKSRLRDEYGDFKVELEGK
ncbi:hypothetical protein [Oceanobacter mangrovi]|uniref:hypothetical protein n=1 Tax=Oceanobacter mangrovi TaxID=2862510 RepID=UPI001C8DD8D4|nr:hypothetical protein [Oceanobacter mangrovi]